MVLCLSAFIVHDQKYEKTNEKTYCPKKEKDGGKPNDNKGKEAERKFRFNDDKRGIYYKWRDTGKCRWERCPFEHPGRDKSSQEVNEESP